MFYLFGALAALRRFGAGHGAQDEKPGRRFAGCGWGGWGNYLKMNILDISGYPLVI